MTARRLFVFAFAAALLVGFGCSNDPAPSGPVLGCSDGGAAGANVVTTSCGGALDAVTEQVDVVIGGPAAGNTTLRGLNFDLTFDDTKLVFVPAANYASPLFPNALVAVSSPQTNRVIVSIQQTGADPAISVGTGEHVVLSLSFKTVPGTTFGATPLTFENTEATTPSATITYADGVLLAYQ